MECTKYQTCLYCRYVTCHNGEAGYCMHQDSLVSLKDKCISFKQVNYPESHIDDKCCAKCMHMSERDNDVYLLNVLCEKHNMITTAKSYCSDFKSINPFL